MVIPLGSHRLLTPPTAVWVITTLDAGVTEPGPAKVPAANSTTEPEQAPALSCSLVNHMLPLPSNNMPHGLLIVGRLPGITLLSSTVVAFAVVTLVAAARSADDISTIVEGIKTLALLFTTQRFPEPSKAIPSGPLKAGITPFTRTATGVRATPLAKANCAALNLKIAFAAESLTHRLLELSKAANCGNLKVTGPARLLIAKLGEGFGVVLRLIT